MFYNFVRQKMKKTSPFYTVDTLLVLNITAVDHESGYLGSWDIYEVI